jgi:hypothetical protein
VPLPAIAHFNEEGGLGHFVVLYHVKKHTVVVGDPARGVEKLSRDAFCRRWTGNLLLLVPDVLRVPAGPGGVPAGPWSRFLSLLRAQTGVLAEACGCAWRSQSASRQYCCWRPRRNRRSRSNRLHGWALLASGTLSPGAWDRVGRRRGSRWAERAQPRPAGARGARHWEQCPCAERAQQSRWGAGFPIGRTGRAGISPTESAPYPPPSARACK